MEKDNDRHKKLYDLDSTVGKIYVRIAGLADNKKNGFVESSDAIKELSDIIISGKGFKFRVYDLNGNALYRETGIDFKRDLYIYFIANPQLSSNLLKRQQHHRAFLSYFGKPIEDEFNPFEIPRYSYPVKIGSREIIDTYYRNDKKVIVETKPRICDVHISIAGKSYPPVEEWKRTF